MRTPADRLREARQDAGFNSASEAAEAMGIVRSTYLGHENGSRGISRAGARYAAFFRVSLDWLMTGKGQAKARIKPIPMVGVVGAGAEVALFDDHDKGEGFIEVDGVLPTPSVALEIRGDSMWPLQEGWRIVFQRQTEGVPREAIGKLCVCRTMDDLTLLKIVRRAEKTDTFELSSWNSAPRSPERLQWAAPVIAILPR